MKKLTKFTTLLLILTFFIFQATAFAETATASKTLSITLTIGQKDIKINETSLTGEAPYITKDNSTLVPLRVITTAFGAVLAYDAPTKTIGLKYNGHDLSLTIDNKMAIVDGKAIEMNTAPQLHNGTTMVPVRFITENFGATITFDKVTKQITITGDAPVADTSGGLNSDAGKTKIGDSYNNWTMKYPTGLVKSYQSYKGDYLNFEDANGEYELNISIDPSDVQNMSADGLLTELADFVTGTVLSKSTATVNGVSFARIISKEEDMYTESRAYFANSSVYTLIMDISEVKNYNNPLKSAGYKELLDSFTLTYDTKDFTTKDISTVKNGYRIYTNDDYGFTLNIPSDWDKGTEDSSKFNFHSGGTEDKTFRITISSLAAGETLDSWVAKNTLQLSDFIVPEYGKIISTTSTTVGNEPAKEMISEFNLEDAWTSDTEFLIIKGNLKYDIDFEYPKDAPAADIQATKEALLQSFAFTDKLNSSLGTIKDDSVNSATLSKIVSKNLGVSFEKPEFWEDSTENADKDTTLNYTFADGFINIGVRTKTPKVDITKYMEDYLKENTYITITANTTATLGGQNFKKITYSESALGVPVNGEIYLYSSATKDYVIVYEIGPAFNTESTKQRFAALIASFQITP
ncbi:copper amine oxidase N-terminal domain-containing protein [Paenibacillus psychroresistens]|uniref:copper amine oxidase N-terminal domain-containing protein n=1 Tax=Paenibacillus psychroresistens TaxID=1778678 RepID=UPI001391C92C|nr:copper amine oxidase N-terminal domain-containing protein [Paenibacillus psychroresistens]